MILNPKKFPVITLSLLLPHHDINTEQDLKYRPQTLYLCYYQDSPEFFFHFHFTISLLCSALLLPGLFRDNLLEVRLHPPSHLRSRAWTLLNQFLSLWPCHRDGIIPTPRTVMVWFPSKESCSVKTTFLLFHKFLMRIFLWATHLHHQWWF